MYAVLMAWGYDSLQSSTESEKTLKTPTKKTAVEWHIHLMRKYVIEAENDRNAKWE